MGVGGGVSHLSEGLQDGLHVGRRKGIYDRERQGGGVDIWGWVGGSVTCLRGCKMVST